MARKIEYPSYDTTITINIASLDETTFEFLQKALTDKNCKCAFEAVNGMLVVKTTVSSKFPIAISTYIPD